MNKKVLNVFSLNVKFLNIFGEITESKKEVLPDTDEYKSCIDAGYWRNQEPWVLDTPWSNTNK